MRCAYHIRFIGKTQKSRPNFSKKTTSVLMNWLSDHIHHPWPTKQEKKELCRLSGLTPKQLRIWFTNNRKRKLNSLAKEQNHGMQDSLPVDASLNNVSFVHSHRFRCIKQWEARCSWLRETWDTWACKVHTAMRTHR